jgi:cysteine-rich repeat protein
MNKLALLFVAGVTLLGACADRLGTTESPISNDDCTLTQGYWKNHPSQWPVTSIQLGTVTYTQAEALDIFDRSVNGNGLVSLAHQLMAAKLNAAAGASNPIADVITQADAMIGGLVVPPVGSGTLATSATAGLVQALDNYNTGAVGPGHCDGVGKPECVCGDGAVHPGEQCDDGNTTDGDGCSSTCVVEGLQ